LARHWVLSKDLRFIIDQAIHAQMTCVIRHKHPQPNNREPRGVEYIGFSRWPAERWVFVLDQFSCKPRNRRGNIHRITFENHYSDVLQNHGVPFVRERGGGRNLFVNFENFEAAVRACSPYIEDVEVALGTREWENVKDEIGFVTEALLEAKLIEHWDKIDFGLPLRFLRSQFPANGFVDIIAESPKKNTLAILELKRGRAGLETLKEQLSRYVYSDAILKLRPGAKVIGAIIARDFAPPLLAAVKDNNFPVALFAYEGKPSEISLRLVDSTW
jgi:hypothetical protein